MSDASAPGPSRRPVELDAPLRAALAMHEAGDFAGAERGYGAALLRDPDHPVALLYLGVLHHDHGRYEEAIRLIRRSIEAHPGEPAAHNHLGIALLAAGDAAQAVRELEQALRIKPDYPDALNNLGNALKTLKRYDEAESAYRKVLAADPRHAFAQFNLGLLHFVRRDFEQAEAAFHRTLEVDSRFHKAHYQLGLTAENLGRFPEAAAHYRRALEASPGHHASMAALLALLDYDPDETTLAAAEELANRGDLPPPHHYTLGFGLAKRFDQRREYDRAFHHLRLANERRGRRVRYGRQEIERSFAETREILTKDFIHRHAVHGSSSERPVFVLGMPRTGTTLTEQILAAHPAVHGAGELPDIARLVNRLPAVMTQALERPLRGYPECLEHLDGDFIRTMAGYYEHVLARQSAQAARVVDKNPFNHLHVGLIAVLFPRARIIHCTRDPRDVGLSCYMELFELKQDFTTDFGSFAHYYRAYEGLMAHWRQALDTPMLEVRYERLVADVESVSREMIEFCGLPWDDACLRHQQSGRAVLTPSRWQVRQPIYGKSVARWRNYATQLEPLLRALQAEGVQLDDDRPG
jgi:tetratricopeptide (TPR) repeat protein